MKVTIIVVFHNGKRVSQNTLYSLSLKYQVGVQIDDYEVIVVDSNSTDKLSQEYVKEFGNNFKYIDFQTDNDSPCDAINFAIEVSKADILGIMIDGAHIATPRAIWYSINIFQVKENIFTYTKGYHLGADKQNYTMLEGYSELHEDKLLSISNWKSEPYNLFKISNFDKVRSQITKVVESNLFFCRRGDMKAIGKYNSKFKSAGGGLVNLDVFYRLIHERYLMPVCLWGEGTFHQIHGGVSTNVIIDNHPIKVMEKEYKSIYGRSYTAPSYTPFLYGQDVSEKAKETITYKDIEKIFYDLFNNDEKSLAKSLVNYYYTSRFKYSSNLAKLSYNSKKQVL